MKRRPSHPGRPPLRDVALPAGDGSAPPAGSGPPPSEAYRSDDRPAARPAARGGRRRRLRIPAAAAERIREEIARAGGREVCFLAGVNDDREVVDPRAVARGNHAAVLAAARDADEGGVMIHNHPSGALEPSEADLAVAARLYDRGLGTAIVDNEVVELFVVVEPPPPRRVAPLDADALDGLLGPDGPLAERHPRYEDRPGQREMLRRVTERYNEGGVEIVEAGTGTGKSLAYLLPAAAWAVRNRERTVVSTATINLQEQLVRKDLPLVAALVDEELDWALVKGRGNYVSIRRARLAAEGASVLFEDDRSAELQAILDWIRSTEDGSLADLSFVPSEEAWEEVRSDADICLRSRCPHFQECFYQASRRRAASARILVANHHLLFSDLAVRRARGNWSDAAVLPAYRHLVLDEAHNVEDAATSHLGVRVTRRGLFRVLARLDRNGKGLLTAVQERLAAADQDGLARDLRVRIEEKVRPSLAAARSRLGLFLDALEPLLPAGELEGVRIGSAELPEPVDRMDVRERLDGVVQALATLEREVARLRAAIEGSDRWADALDGRVLDLGAAERRLAAAGGSLRAVLDPGDEAPDLVRWMERTGRRGDNLVLAAAPVDVGALLRSSLFQKVDTTILTSATLAARRRFDFLRERLGLGAASLAREEEGPVVRETLLDSPFDYRNQTFLGVPTDLPDLRTGDDAFQRATARALETLAERTDGGVFGLFTSYRALRRVAEELRASGADRRWPLLVHGEDDRSRLLAAFLDSGRAMLLGTASFWEGVDVPGDPLRGLVLQKLPFRVPTEPVTAARVEAVERAGGNPFWDYMLPLAALRLKQGFGRLVRSREDRGAVLLLDDRVVRRRYGRYFLDSLPDTPLVKGPWNEIAMALRRFYG